MTKPKEKLTIGHDEIICPYCGNVMPSYYNEYKYISYHGYHDNNKEYIVTCDDCWKKFKLREYVHRDYETVKEEEDFDD
jgi:hypothetical protein